MVCSIRCNQRGTRISKYYSDQWDRIFKSPSMALSLSDLLLDMQIHFCMDGWLNALIVDGWTDGRTDVQTDGQTTMLIM